MVALVGMSCAQLMIGSASRRRVNAAITIRIGFWRMDNITGVQQGIVKVDRTFA
jgi:hypothetical protein